jgi:peptide/nickel transport system substrate-binding protein
VAPTARPPESKPAAQAAGTPKRGGELRVTGSTSRSVPEGFDPHLVNGSMRAASLMFESLTELKGDYTPAPLLAESWSPSPDNTVWTFNIRKGVRFHNGRPLSSDDVRYSFERILDPATNSPGRTTYSIINKIDTPDPNTVVFTLKGPYAPFATIVSAIEYGSAIVPKEEVAKGDFANRPVGTGAFKWREQVVGQYVVLDRNPDYWMPGLPYLDSVRFLDPGDPQSALLRLRAGDIDIYIDAPGENFRQFKDDPQFMVYGGTGLLLTWAWLGLNEARVAAFKDVRVRQAIFWALDRATLSAAALPDLSVPLPGGFLPASHWAALNEPLYPKPDLAKAKQLLADAGYPNGFSVKLETSAAVSHFPQAIQVIQQQLKQVGIDCTLNVTPTSPPPAQRAEMEMYVWGFPGSPDPDQEFQQDFMPNGGNNYFGWQDDQLGALVQQGRSTSDQTARTKTYQDAQRLVAQKGWIANLYSYDKYDIAYPYLKGYVFPPTVHESKPARGYWLDK